MNYNKVINDLNQLAFEKAGEIEDQFYYTTNGDVYILGFGELKLWVSCNEEYEDSEKNLSDLLISRLKERLDVYAKVCS